MSHKQWHSCALVKTILHIANDAEFCDEQCLSTFPDPVLMMMSLNIADGAVFWCLYQECSWLHTSDLRVVMTSEDQTPIGRWWFCSECKIWDRQMADRQTEGCNLLLYFHVLSFIQLALWRSAKSFKNVRWWPQSAAEEKLAKKDSSCKQRWFKLGFTKNTYVHMMSTGINGSSSLTACIQIILLERFAITIAAAGT